MHDHVHPIWFLTDDDGHKKTDGQAPSIDVAFESGRPFMIKAHDRIVVIDDDDDDDELLLRFVDEFPSLLEDTSVVVTHSGGPRRFHGFIASPTQRRRTRYLPRPRASACRMSSAAAPSGPPTHRTLKEDARNRSNSTTTGG